MTTQLKESRINSLYDENSGPKGADLNYTVNEEKNSEFIQYLDTIKKNLVDKLQIPEFGERLLNIFKYAAITKSNRAILTVDAYRALEEPGKLTPGNIELVNIVAWCVQLLEVADLIKDDILDKSVTRYGVPCWHKQADNVAVLDIMILETSAYTTLNTYLSSHPSYAQIMRTIVDCTFNLAIGQSMDISPRSLDKFTMEDYIMLAKYKAGYYTYLFPVTLAAHLSQTYSDELYQQFSSVLLDMANFLQIKDDYYDKVDDTKDGKFTWFAVVALEKATPDQRKVMENHYGKPDEKSVNAILHLYEELGLYEYYKSYKEKFYRDICICIDKIQNISLSQKVVLE